MEVVMTTGA